MWKIYTVLLGYLTIETRRDIRERQISVRNTLFLAIVMIICRMGKAFLTGALIEEMLFLAKGVLPGVFLILLGAVTRQAIGYGDGLLLLACGLCLGGEMAGILLLTGLFLLFPVSLSLLLCGKAQRKTQLPFAPFLLAAYLICLAQVVG